MPGIKKIHEVAYHRNGVGGVGFHAVRFEVWDDRRNVRQFVATVFPDEGCVAVLAIDRLDTDGVAFWANSWRGDVFEFQLREAIRKYDFGQ